jgi:uncharacterized protein with HEPN domain
MERDSRAYLWEIDECAGAIGKFVRGRTLDDYISDRMLRSAVKREITIIGEALRQLSKRYPDVAETIPHLPRIVGLRNILVHGYASVNHAMVWSAIENNLSALQQCAQDLLRQLGDAP